MKSVSGTYGSERIKCHFVWRENSCDLQYVLHSFTQVYDYLCTRLRIRNEDMRLWSMEDEVCILYVIAQCNMMRT